MKEDVLSLFEDFEENKRELNEAQRTYLRGQFNLSKRFAYAEGHLCYIFEASVETYNNMLYYLGFEYEEESLDILIRSNGKVLVSYHTNERMDELIEALEKLKA